MQNDFDTMPTDEWIGLVHDAAADRGSVHLRAAGAAFEQNEADTRRTKKRQRAIAGLLGGALLVLACCAGWLIRGDASPAPAWIRITHADELESSEIWALPATIEIDGSIVTITAITAEEAGSP